MGNAIGPVHALQTLSGLNEAKPQLNKHTENAPLRADSVRLGAGRITAEETVKIILERSYDKIRNVVSAANGELGIPEDAVVDTSAEATANRIADFALASFGSFQKSHPELSEEEAKTEFVELIGDAIEQGFSEAKEILGALNAITGDVSDKVDTIFDVVQERLNAFLSAE